MPRRWHAYKSLEWFIFIGFAMAAFFALVATVMLITGGRQARVVWQQPQVSATPVASATPTPIPSPAADTAGLPSEALAKEGWQTYRNEELGVEFLYPPEGFGARFISIHSTWPPAVIITPSGSRLPCEVSEYPGRDGHTQREAVVNNHRYCVRNSGDAAAGSAYHDLQYTTVKEGRAVTLAFTLRYTNCGAYDPPEMQACEVERRPFSPDPVVDKIFSTLRFIEPDTTNWQTYRNEELGFEVRYPKNWIAEVSGNRIEPSKISITLSEGVMAPSVSNIIIQPHAYPRQCPASEPCPGLSSERMIAGKLADVFDSQSERPYPSTSRLIIFRDPKTEYAEFQIEMYAGETGKVAEVLKIHEAILQTFRFIK